ncbi:Hint domain-containing protein [Yoonia maricola]|uniref:Hint domain-containing protein n=1 Tax=Yoonia maricola TaxID=420999 RepID=A0A2M8WLK5_9RHOB|nr:Hint domain-containing protein [Yoonia maricola]PJI91807.1 Hint domain-containing protein [Yoonia maricola]
MPTSFTVFGLGVLADIDTTEGNSLAENANALVGATFGGSGNALLNSAVTFAPGTGGFAGGSSTSYDQDNNPNENFTIDGGADQVFDAAVIYNATVTYVDGTTDTITAVIFQDVDGNTYWAPEINQTVGQNADQDVLEFAAIRSLTLDSLSGDSFAGLSGNREAWDFVTCYVASTMIETETGAKPIEALTVGDLVLTRDRGLQTIRWIGQSTVAADGKLAPVRISAGSLGQNAPARDLLVSRQHRMLVSSAVCERMFGNREILVPAIKLTGLPGVFVDEAPSEVTYYHLMTDQHDIVYAEGVPSETLLSGPQAMEALPKQALDELLAIFPNILTEAPEPARQIERSKRIERLIIRHQRNDIPLAIRYG